MTGATCQRCGFPLPADARFCPNCGAPVAVPVTQERRLVTVLFADLASSTEIASNLDPERNREVIAAFFRMASDALVSLRGRAEKFVGDAAMAVFGLPQTHETDALRALRAGLMIRDQTPRLAEGLTLAAPLRVRVGLATGPVATGSGPPDQLLVTGPAVNLAKRLQEAAEPGEVLADEVTWQLTNLSVAFGPSRVVPARGFQGEVRAWPAEGLSTRSVRRTIPMVGRRRELTLLLEAFERTRETSRTHLVTVLGERGIGKRRLVEEFLSSLPTEADVMVGEATEFEEDATLAAVADLLRRELGIERDTPDEDVRKALEGAVAAAVDPDEVDQVAGRLGLVLGVGDQGREGRRYRAAEIRAGFTSFVAGKARARPVVLVFQELQHAQPGVFDLIEHVLGHARRIPLTVVCSARDDLLEERPGWGGGVADAVTIRLEPLSGREAEELARAAGEDLDDETAAAIALHTGGNPFFIVETTAMLLQAHDDIHAIGAAHSHVLPPTVQAVVASRVDHLPERARDLVRKASVFPDGRFTVEDLAIITDPSTETLETLVDEEILVRDPKRTDIWRFRHGVLQDVAYDSLPKRERERLHLRAADVIEERSEGRRPRAVAYHLERAARAALDLDPNDRRLLDRAVEALVTAGHEARRRIQSRTAIDLYERALDLGGAEERWGVREARILAGIGEARYWLGDYESAAGALRRALDLAAGDPWTDSLAGRFLADILLNVEGRPDLATDLFDRALAAARALDDQWPIARTLLMAGWAPYWQGDLEGARAMFEEALVTSRANPDPDPWAEARALTSLASVISPQGDEADCLALGRQALDLGRSMKDPFTVAVALGYVGNSLRRMWHLGDALPCLEEAVATFRDLDARWELASALGDRGHIHRLSGQYADAEGDLREALKLCRHLNERSLISWTAAELSWILVAQGNHEAARRIIDDAVDRASVDLPDVGTSLLVAQAVLALSNGDREAGLRLARRSLDNERSVGWRNPVAAQTWLLGSLFGADEVGGEDALEDARATLESAHWLHAVNEPDLIRGVAGPAVTVVP